MTLTQQFITIGVCVLGTMLTRFLPFLLFGSNRSTPKYVQYLGRILPGAIFSMLVIYCLRSVQPLQYSYGLSQAIAIAVTVGAASLEKADAALHHWRHGLLHAADSIRILKKPGQGGASKRRCPSLFYPINLPATPGPTRRWAAAESAHRAPDGYSCAPSVDCR